MAQRYWTVHTSMGYVGTKNEEAVDVLDLLGVSKIELQKMTNDEH